MNGKKIAWLQAAVVASLLVGTSAHAQWDPESGDTGQWTPPPEEPPAQQQQQQQPPAQQPPANGWQQAPAQQPPQQQPQQQGWGTPQQTERPPGQGGPAETEAPAASNGATDHSQVSFGATFFGLDDLTLLPADGTNDAIRLRMPAIGIRYWVSESIGLDIGVGLGILSDQTFDECSGPNCESVKIGGIDGGFGFRLHFGLPVALKTYEHFNVLLTPEIGFLYGGATIYNVNDPLDDIALSSFALDVGVKIGGELQFGFWGVPNLALQANIGLGLRYQSTSAANDRLPGMGLQESKNTNLSLRTIADDLAGAIRIVYYF